ncbi:putative adenosine monophosphate-protein transferase fic [compost metagenome]
MADSHAMDQDPYCYPGTTVLRNRLGLTTEEALNEAERTLSEIAASEIEFALPPYDLPALQRIHRQLFGDLYDWAGELRTLDIAKGGTQFCNEARIEPEAEKIFNALASANWLEGLDRGDLVAAAAEHFGDLNMIHPFRDGNGRAQRILFEHLIINAGYEISWWPVEEGEWLRANIEAVFCDYGALVRIFGRCIGRSIV